MNGWIYIFYSAAGPDGCRFYDAMGNHGSGPRGRLSRFTMLPDETTVDPSTEFVLFETLAMAQAMHSSGNVAFGKDGLVYVTVGDTGHNPRALGGGVSQDLSNLLGSIIRVTDTGAIPSSNPHTGAGSVRCRTGGNTAGAPCQEIFASGLRNPFRMAMNPNVEGTRFYVNDVGGNSWEEISEGGEGFAGANYGWPLYEGPECTNAYTRGTGDQCPSTMLASCTAPVHSYPHRDPRTLLIGDTPGGPGGCVTGAAFVPDGVWPAEYEGAYLYTDYVHGEFMMFDSRRQGSKQVSAFRPRTASDRVIVLQFGPFNGNAGSALFYLNRSPPSLNRITFVGGRNRAPVAVVATSGPTFSAAAGLVVQFDASGSSDADGDSLVFSWDFEGRGTADSTAESPSHTFSTNGVFFAALTVSDGQGGSDAATVRIDVGNLPPHPVIVSPSDEARFAVGDVLTLDGTASDEEDGLLGELSLTWEVRRHHNEHWHPFLTKTAGNGIQLAPAPQPEDLLSTNTSYLEILLTAEDSLGRRATTRRLVLPKTVTLEFATSPPALDLLIAGDRVGTPFTVVLW